MFIAPDPPILNPSYSPDLIYECSEMYAMKCFTTARFKYIRKYCATSGIVCRATLLNNNAPDSLSNVWIQTRAVAKKCNRTNCWATRMAVQRPLFVGILAINLRLLANAQCWQYIDIQKFDIYLKI